MTFEGDFCGTAWTMTLHDMLANLWRANKWRLSICGREDYWNHYSYINGSGKILRWTSSWECRKEQEIVIQCGWLLIGWRSQSTWFQFEQVMRLTNEERFMYGRLWGYMAYRIQSCPIGTCNLRGSSGKDFRKQWELNYTWVRCFIIRHMARLRVRYKR